MQTLARCEDLMWCQEHFLYLYFLYKTHDGHIHGTFFALLLKFCKGSVRVSLLYQTFNCLITTGVANNTRSVHSLFFFSWYYHDIDITIDSELLTYLGRYRKIRFFNLSSLKSTDFSHYLIYKFSLFHYSFSEYRC